MPRRGGLGITDDAGRQKVRKIAEAVIARFPSVRFWVFHKSDHGVTMQDFWEAVL